jgi:DNA polymerase-3 subunit beta
VEQLNIVGKRSGDGFVAHKAMLVNALSRGLAERVMLMDFTIGRKGLLGYLKALGGSNIVKLLPQHPTILEALEN